MNTESLPSDVFPANLYASIRRQRELQGLTLSDLENLSGISKKTLIKLEHGGDVRLSSFLKVLGALGISFALKSSSLSRPAEDPLSQNKHRSLLTEEMKDGWF